MAKEKKPDNLPPLLPKPTDDFWALCNRYYADGESVQFKCMRGYDYAEGTGKVTRATKNQYGRVSYLVKPDNKAALKHGSSEERKSGQVHANLEDLFGGPWSSYDPARQDRGRKHETHGGVATPEKVYEFRITTNDEGKWTLHRSTRGFASDFEVMGWLDYLHREMIVSYMGALKPPPESEKPADEAITTTETGDE